MNWLVAKEVKMKFYFASVIVRAEPEGLEVDQRVLVAAADKAQALGFLREFASNWGGDDPTKVGKAKWHYGDSEDEGYTVEVNDAVHAISPATFEELSGFLPNIGRPAAALGAGKGLPEVLKSVASRMREAPSLRDIPGIQGKLLQAMSHALTAKSWESLLSRTLTVKGAPDLGLEASAPDYAAVTDALWLTEGEVPTAAAVLRAPQAAIHKALGALNTSVDEVMARRPKAWRPAHSLARDFGLQATAEYTLLFEQDYCQRITGRVGTSDLSYSTNVTPEWSMGSFSVPPVRMNLNAPVMACAYETFRQVLLAKATRAMPPTGKRLSAAAILKADGKTAT